MLRQDVLWLTHLQLTHHVQQHLHVLRSKPRSKALVLPFIAISAHILGDLSTKRGDILNGQSGVENTNRPIKHEEF